MSNWTADEVRSLLDAEGWNYSEREIQNGIQFIVDDETRSGTKVNLFETGSVNVQGKNTEINRAASEIFSSPKPTAFPASPNRSTSRVRKHRVFVVYGHDQAALTQLENLLRKLKLEPIVLQDMPGSGDTIIEKLDNLTDADYACVLLTPDDEGRKKNEDEETKPRARQNVILELGMVLAKLGRGRVSIIIKGDTIEKPSDIAGLIYIRFESNVVEVKNEIAGNLMSAGFEIDSKDLVK